MTLIDNIIKWFKAPKTFKGIAGLIGIVIVLALDFAYWAGAIEWEEKPPEYPPEDYEKSITGSLEHGRMLRPGLPDPRGEGEGETYNLYLVLVEWKISEIQIVSDGDGGRPRMDGGDSNDINLYLYAPKKEAGGNFESTDPDYKAATPYIEETLRISRSLELGNWTLRVDCYTGNNVQYNIQIQVFYARGNETEEEP